MAIACRFACRTGKVQIRTRTGLDWTKKFAAVAKAAKALPDGIYRWRNLRAG